VSRWERNQLLDRENSDHFESQAREAPRNLEAVLHAAGSDPHARATPIVSLPGNLKVSIECIAIAATAGLLAAAGITVLNGRRRGGTPSTDHGQGK
jgi:hypothetical protein